MAPCKSPNLSCSEISSRGNEDPLSRIFFILGQFGCLVKIGSRSDESLNSDPYDIGEKADDRIILSRSMSLSLRTLKFSTAAASVRLKLKGGAEGTRAGASMAAMIFCISLTWEGGMVRHFLLNGLGAKFDSELEASLISEWIRWRCT